jgi:hypothetical protein
LRNCDRPKLHGKLKLNLNLLRFVLYPVQVLHLLPYAYYLSGQGASLDGMMAEMSQRFNRKSKKKAEAPSQLEQPSEGQ